MSHTAMDKAITDCEAQLQRVDTKAGLLLGFAGALLLYAATAIRTAHTTPSLALNSAALTAFTTACIHLLRGVWPRISGADHASWPHYARCSRDEIRMLLTDHTDRRADRIHQLSRMVLAKYKTTRWGIAFLTSGLGLLIAAHITTSF